MKTDNPAPEEITPVTPAAESPKIEIAPVIKDLVTAQGKMGDKEFCREFNFSYHESTWSKIRRGIYNGDMEKAVNACTAMLRRIKERKALAAKVRQGVRYCEFPPQRTVLDRIGLLQESKVVTQNRLVMYLAGTGGGKSALSREVCARYGGTPVEAKESWRSNYFAALVSICHAVGCTGEELTRSPRVAENALIAALKNRKIVLVIDEGEYFGPKSLNLIKLILNQTPTVILICAIPELWDRVKSYGWIEAAQIMRRTDHVERLLLIQPEEVQTFLVNAGVNLNGTAEDSARIVAKHANQFGLFDLIGRVAERLADGEPHNSEVVETTCISIKAMIGFGGGK